MVELDLAKVGTGVRFPSPAPIQCPGSSSVERRSEEPSVAGSIPAWGARMFLESKYTTWYFAIISDAKNLHRTKASGYFENHHIVPKALGGAHNFDNRVLLTAREHFVCHFLLYKMLPLGSNARHRMLHSFMLMKGKNEFQKTRYMNGRLYEAAKLEYALVRSAARRGKALSLEHRAKIANSRTGRSIVSLEGRLRISLLAKTRKRRPFTEQERRNIGDGMRHARALRLGKQADTAGTAQGSGSKPAPSTISGAIAQLGERLNGIQEVGRADLPGSTKFISNGVYDECLSVVRSD